MVIKATKRIFNSDKICRSYSDLNFGVTFLEHSVYYFRRYIYQLNDILDLEPFTRDWSVWQTVFTALHGMQTRYSFEKVVLLSVCQTRGL